MSSTSKRESLASDFPPTRQARGGLLHLTRSNGQRTAADAMVIAFRTDPAIIRTYVPRPLETLDDGLAFLWSSELRLYTNRHTRDFIDPRRTRVSQSILKVPCVYEGTRYLFNVFAWTDQDWLGYVGRLSGVPQKLAQISLTQFHSADRLYSGPGEGVRVCVAVDSLGMIAKGWVDLSKTIPSEQLPFELATDHFPRMLSHRYMYDVVEGRPVLNDLCAHWPEKINVGEIWNGSAWLEFPPSDHEELANFAPLEVFGGYWYTLAWGHGGQSRAVVVHRFE